MTARSGPVARAVRIAESDAARVLAELGRARRTAGLSHLSVGRACGMSRSIVQRIESGTRHAAITELAAIGATVGRDVRLQVFLAGDPLRDAGQLRLLDRFRRRLNPAIRMATEVPLPITGDSRAWDAVISGAGWRRPVEAETVVDDCQALDRRLALKVRDGDVDGLILVVADTVRNRRALNSVPTAFSAFDRNARRVLAALAGGRDPGPSLIFL